MSLPLLTGCVSQAAAGSGGIPASIVARESLQHWWKFDEGSTTAATDYGLSATASTALAMSNVEAISGGGPTALGSPNNVRTDGVTDTITTATTDGAGTPVGVGYTIDHSAGNAVVNDQDGMTISFWFKADASPSNYDILFLADGSSTAGSWGNGGCGAFMISSTLRKAWAQTYVYNVASSSIAFGTWEHFLVTFPKYAQTSTDFNYYRNGSLISNTAWGPGARTYEFHSGVDANSKFCIGAQVKPTGVINYTAVSNFSDFRIYTGQLSAANAAAIAAGDW